MPKQKPIDAALAPEAIDGGVEFDVRHPPAQGVRMIQTTRCGRLRPEERLTMARMRQQGFGARDTARALGRSRSPIDRSPDDRVAAA